VIASSGKAPRVAYFCDAPWIGGAERYLGHLALGMDRGAFEPVLIMDRNERLAPLKDSMTRAGIGVREVSLDFSRFFSGARELGAVLRELRPRSSTAICPGRGTPSTASSPR